MLRPPLHFLPPLGPPRSSPRERALAEWRGINLAPLEKARSLTAKPAGDVLPKILSEIRIDRRQSEAEIVKVWNSLISPLVTAHAQPTGLRKGTLFVTVDSSLWLAEIVQWHREEILERLQHSFGRDYIARISFRVG